MSFQLQQVIRSSNISYVLLVIKPGLDSGLNSGLDWTLTTIALLQLDTHMRVDHVVAKWRQRQMLSYCESILGDISDTRVKVTR